ncbi:MAG: hypothetical protein ACLFRD_09430, partial [Nitriliruptoraceae bacterium]
GEELLEDARQQLLGRGFDLDRDDGPPHDGPDERRPPARRPVDARPHDHRDRPRDTGLRL